jgi:hypothetical protein
MEGDGSAAIFAVSLGGRGFPSLPHRPSDRALGRPLSDKSPVGCDVGHTVGSLFEKKRRMASYEITESASRDNGQQVGSISLPFAHTGDVLRRKVC